MIPPRLLVYRRTESGANLETLPETWRRKKSCGDLFQNGYRVRQGRPGLEEKERRTGLSHSVWSCLCLLCNWGKEVGCCRCVHTTSRWKLRHNSVALANSLAVMLRPSRERLGGIYLLLVQVGAQRCARRRSTECVVLCKNKKDKQAGRAIVRCCNPFVSCGSAADCSGCKVGHEMSLRNCSRAKLELSSPS